MTSLPDLSASAAARLALPGRATIVAPLVAQRVQIAEPLDVALAAAGDAVAQPVLLVDDLAVELVLVALFFRQHLVAPGLERRKAAVDLADLAAVEPGGGARQIGEETTVMADDDQRATPAFQFAFQPFDGRQVEMVGRFVQQQNVGRGRQHPRQRRAAGLAAGNMRRVFFAGQAELLDADSAPGNDRRRGRGRPRHRPASSCGRRSQAPAADSGWWRRAARSGCRRRVRRCRQRSSEASICPSRCGRSGRRARLMTPTAQRPTTAAYRQRSALYLSTGSAAAPFVQSWFGAGCCARWRWMRRMVWSSADKNAERSRGE